jgi:hypothetical protein
MSTAAVASAIAETYCKAFSSCCVGIGQPPIDVARCRSLTAAAAQKELDAAGASDVSAQDANACVDAIHTRIAACGKEDIHWENPQPAFFDPELVQAGCLPLLPNAKVFGFEACSASMPCTELGATCAIDVCSSGQPPGAACGAGCLDSASCVAGTCAVVVKSDVGAACKINDDCRLGLVCATGTCAPSRGHPDLATQRSSPYRIGGDTCRAFAYL